MKVALIGATGFVGSHLLNELLDKKHEVTAISRSADKIKNDDVNLTKVKVDIADIDALTEALRGNQIVISAFNAGWDNANLYDDYLKGLDNIQTAIRAANIRRYFVVGNAGTLYNGGTQLVDTSDFPEKMKEGAKASRDYFDQLRRETYLDWVYLSPAVYIDKETASGGRTGRFRTDRDEPIIKDGISSISVEDLAVSVVEEIDTRSLSRQQYTVGY